jgi:uncharacterized Zn finger protein
LNLSSELTSWCKHQTLVILTKLHEHWQAERKRLAGSRLSKANHVNTSQSDRNR